MKIVDLGLDRSMVPLLIYIHLFSMKKESAPEIPSQDLQIINEVQNAYGPRCVLKSRENGSNRFYHITLF